MKVLFIVEMDDSMNGGLFVTTHNKIKTLLEEFEGYSVDVFCLTVYDGEILSFIKKKLYRNVRERQAANLKFEGINYISLYMKETLTRKFLKKFGLDSFYYREPAARLKAADYDMVSAHWGNPQGSLAYYLKKHKKIPYSLTLHGSDVHSLRSNWKKKLVVRNMRQADAVFFVSQQLKKEAEKIGWTDLNSTSHIVYNAVDTRVFYPYTEKAIKLIKAKYKTHTYVVGFVGNLNKVKRADCLIDLFKEIQNKAKKNITFYIIGEGPLKTNIKESAAQTGLDIRIIGNVPQNKLLEYYNMMNCCVLPSRNEGFPNVISESQACGTPIVASKVGGIPEAVADLSLLVSADETHFIGKFAFKVNKILKSGEKVDIQSQQWRDIVEKEVKVWKNIHTFTKKKSEELQNSVEKGRI